MSDGGLPAGSRAVLIGVSAYEYADFPPIIAARNSLRAMHSLLADPVLCGWRPELITVIADPISAADLADRVADLAETTTGVLLLYYVGHGVLSTRGELCLTVSSTRPNRPKITGLPWETLAEVLRSCPARARLAILDCCFSGQAIEALGTGDDSGVADITHVSGVYTLTATTRNRTAHVPPPGQQDTACTSFTGELEDLIRSGIPGKPSQLTFGDIYPELLQRLRSKGLPTPSQRGTDTAHQFPFTANPAAHAEADVHVIRPQGDGNGSRKTTPAMPEPRRPRQDRILADALHVAWSITAEESRAVALARIAGAVAAADPDRAGQLAADAEYIAQSIDHSVLKERTLVLLSCAVAAADPDRAERIAQSITEKYSKVLALAGVAGALAAADPDRARQLADDAEDVARSITSEQSRVLARIAEAMAPSDPDRAERVAQSISQKYPKALALASVAEAVAAADPDRAKQIATDAERIAQSITEVSKGDVLARIAEAMAPSDPDRAERIAQSISKKYSKALALASVLKAVAAADPDRTA
jgi:hypothetical protein